MLRLCGGVALGSCTPKLDTFDSGAYSLVDPSAITSALAFPVQGYEHDIVTICQTGVYSTQVSSPFGSKWVVSWTGSLHDL